MPSLDLCYSLRTQSGYGHVLPASVVPRRSDRRIKSSDSSWNEGEVKFPGASLGNALRAKLA